MRKSVHLQEVQQDQENLEVPVFKEENETD